MPVYRLVLAYDGERFAGWQRQPGLRTVQGELERALAVVARVPVRVQGAGRTDTGVHALGQCASFALDAPLPAARLLASLRGLLPEDVTPRELHRAPDDFHARFSAAARFYTYRLGLQACAPLRRLRWDLPCAVDPAAMRAALPALRAAEDFRGFATREGAARGSVCRIRELELVEADGELRLHIGADRFLHKMVRIITGTLVEVGRGRWGPGRVAEILLTGDRTLAGPTAPAHGLFLRRVEYPEHQLTAPPAEPSGPLD
ncbi:MAG: tRNA pseudouridine(38-40) synthase TruA [Candidatus Krumholzibacteriota bacterium]|nr:tRNA pseudouridine(38-40) synthase TruA [Candidatus Krumholzibacteriota bacterium]